jgi:hypothetical protein
MKTPSKLTVRGLVVVALTALLLGLVPGISGAQASSTVGLPLVECVTGTGTISAPKSLPAMKAMGVPANLARQLAVYTDDQAELYLIAPLGWTCQASLGADGNDSIAVYPPGEVGTSQFALGHTWPRVAEAVTGDLLPSCYSCFVGQACTFFSAAEHDMLRTYGNQLTCSKLPSGEGIERVSPTAVAFEDPAGVGGTGEPSGGAYPANGVVTFKQSTSTVTYGSAMETCTLPRAQHAVCAAAIAAFLSAWYRDAGP